VTMESDVMNEFPFVAELPKREKSKLRKVWDRLKDFQEFMQKEGECVPPVVAAGLLDVSRQRVHELIQEASLREVRFEGHPYVTVNSIVDHCKSERKAGRPVKEMTMRRAMGISKRMVRQARGK
jgi:hypothetical protein